VIDAKTRPVRWRAPHLGVAAAILFGILAVDAHSLAAERSPSLGQAMLSASRVPRLSVNAASDCSSQPDGEWSRISEIGAPSSRYGHTAVWDGIEMLVWGGGGPVGYVRDGGRYNPLTDTWRPISTVGAPSLRGDHLAVWTGKEMIVWGGNDPSSRSNAGLADGARYDPVADTWRPVSTDGGPGIDSRSTTGETAVWTGSEVLLLRSEPRDASQPDRTFHLFRYDPVTDAWTEATPVPVSGLYLPVMVWTGARLIVWGQVIEAPFHLLETNVGALWDPDTDTWTPMSVAVSISARANFAAAWTGARLLVWGGAGSRQVGDGGVYDVATGSWEALPELSAPLDRSSPLGAWTGHEMLIWGGHWSDLRTVRLLDDGAAFDPMSASWRSLPPAPISGRTAATAVWTGDRMIIFGGMISRDPRMRGSIPVNEGASYMPACSVSSPLSIAGLKVAQASEAFSSSGRTQLAAANAPIGFTASGCSPKPNGEWSRISEIGAPAPRRGHTAVWDGREMLIWGGGGPTGFLRDGGRYDPLTDTWRTISTVGAPSLRGGHLAVWTGEEMIVWGGNDYSSTPARRLTEGARYDPVADTWKAISFDGGPPVAAVTSTEGSAVWTGREMLILTATRPKDIQNTTFELFRYDPATDEWTQAATVPISGLYFPVALWTGTRLIVWGARALRPGRFEPTNVGALWDPETDAWAPISSSGAPSERISAATVWTGEQMLVWGGGLGGGLDDGGVYDLAADLWAPLPDVSAPSQRTQPVGIWTGREMLIWGGITPIGRGAVRLLDDGGAFDPAADAWRSLSPAVISGRRGATAVWASDRMIIFGGAASDDPRLRGAPVNDGARYMPPC